MRVQEIKELLRKRGLQMNAASFWPDSVTESEQYRISKEGGIWEVYYSERGNKNSLTRFLDEGSACAYLLSVLDNDKTVWQVSRSD